MKPFMDEDFLLSTPTAKRLFHTYAADMPIIDYHCHVSPEEIFKDRTYDNITQVWLGGDHYKWRIMRSRGESERLITGDGSDYNKFRAFARSLPHAPGNPVYHWAHLELKRYFGCEIPLNDDSADEIWNICNKVLQNGLSVRKIIENSNVVGLVTTDDPADSLEWHEKLHNDPSFKTVIKPAWRPDKLMGIGMPGFAKYISELGSVKTMESLREVTLVRMNHFDANGCTASDHGLDFLECVPATESELDVILAKALRGEAVSHREAAAYQFACMLFMGAEYAKRGWVMEIHFGALRNVNTAQFDILGADTGYDAVAPRSSVSGLPSLLDALNTVGALPKTVLFSLSPNDNAMLNTICGAFQSEGVRGHVQQGTAWWFNDTKQGMIDQMSSMASLSTLGSFLGMATDSRSFLSYTRHEYFRRILCDMLGGWVENGEYLSDEKHLGRLVQDISYNNVKDFFGY